MVNMNIFRILGDVSHTASKCILIWAIHTNQSAEGVSLITQMLYAAVFCTRYLDLFWVSPGASVWNFILKNFYILSSLYIIMVMLRVFPRTRERERAWKFGGINFGGALIAAPFVSLIFRRGDTSFMEVLWTFSIILESICVLPQLLLLRQTTVPTVIDSFYLVTLGSYRAFYILNWIYRLGMERHFDPIAVIFGIIQTAFYVDFAWVYWTRQRVKLRNGGVVDSEDLSRGWLVSRLLGQRRDSLDPEDGNTNSATNNTNTNSARSSWGARGISVSADEQVLDSQNKSNKAFSSDERARDKGTADILKDDQAHSGSLVGKYDTSGDHTNGLSNGHEWREGGE